MANIFQHVGINKPKRTKFDGGHEVKLSTNFGVLTPILCEPVIPGDVFRCNTEMFLRFAPLQAPIMHRINVFTHFFFVPSRLLWEDFKEFITGGEDGTALPVYPRAHFGNAFEDTPPNGIGSLMDYLGFPIGMDYDIDLLPFRAYALIYNEYYRDQNLEDEIPIDFTSGTRFVDDDTDDIQLFKLRYRCFEKDYFTSALPFAQRGPSVTINSIDSLNLDGPIELSADVSSGSGSFAFLGYPNTKDDKERIKAYPADVNLQPNAVVDEINYKDWLDTNLNQQILAPDGSLRVYANAYNKDSYEPNLYLKGQFSNIGVTATTINDLRKAIQLQKWLERNARGGARYIEQILSHFGVVSSDARLQRPEYLGGGMSPVSIQGVVQNSASEGAKGTPQGNLSGMATAVGNTHQFTHYFEEHGYVIGIMSVMPRTSYQQGLPRKYQKFDKFDYFWPEFAHLGEQEVLNSELYYTGTESDKQTFGYQSRYAEYKSIQSSVHGDFRDTLKFWHAGRIFGNAPQLNADFVHMNPESLDRIWAVGNNLSSQKIYVELYNDLKMIRPMPFLGEPGWMDHF